MPVKPRGNSWQATVCHNGQRRRKDFPTKHEAVSWELSTKAALVTGVDMQPARKSATTISDVLDAVVSRYWRGTSAERAQTFNALESVEFFGADTPISRIDNQGIRLLIEHLRKKGNANGTINRKLAALSKMLTLAYDEDYILKKPKIERLKESEGRLEWWTDEMEKAAIAECERLGEKTLQDFIVLSIDTGMRLSETFKVTPQDIDWSQGRHGLLFVWETKNGSARSIPLTRRAAEIVKNRSKITNASLFSDTSKDALRHRWIRLIEMLGSPEGYGSFHTLRHTFCSRLVQAGVPLMEVMKLAGHKSMQVTLRYAKLAPSNLDAAIALLER